MTTLKPISSKVIDINHKRTKEEIEQGLQNLKKFYERERKIKNIIKMVRYGSCR